ncbi:hypothetical protein RIF29_36769 [Crotalaria pallida]|uniref:C2H2-type domain-containing protein n=1 Tax=Crotalaria pallida TaxID=3830 RepID=A0AAN9EI25_CROPI
MDTNSPTPPLPPPDYDTTYHHHPPPSCVVDASSSSSHHRSARSRNPRKKRTITISDKNNNNNNNNNVVVVLKANNNKIVKKPDPRAPKITRPCTECGKKFWSWKALFGHMRCHPERQWRGINPPPNLARQQHHQHQHQYHDNNDHDQLVGEEMTSNEDREAAACLLLLANRTGIGFGNGKGKGKGKGKVAVKEDEDINMNMRVNDGLSLTTAECLSLSVCGQQQERFECSSCKKVFGSHQALGGHRASHKNVKGCFAINVDDHNLVSMNHMIHSHSGGVGDAGGATCSSGLVGDYHYQHQHEHGDDTNGGDQNQQQQGQQDEGHKCSICHRVFSTGQALGGHKRCHWDKGGDVILSNIAPPTPPPNALPLDLNFPPLPPQQEPPPLSLDLRLAL